MRAILLEKLALQEQNFPANFPTSVGLRKLTLGTYFKYVRFQKELTPRFLENFLRKNDDNTDERLFWKFIREKGLYNFSGTTLRDFADTVGYNLVIWAGNHYSNGVRPAHTVVSDIGVSDCILAVPAAYRLRMSDTFRIEKLPKLKFINEMGAIQKLVDANTPSKTFPEWVSQKSKMSLESVLTKIKAIFGDHIPFNKERSFLNEFGFGYQISYKDHECSYKSDRATVFLKKSNCADFLNLEFEGRPPNRRHILMTDLFILNEKVKVYACPNSWCQLPPNSRLDVIEDHIKNCKNETVHIYETRKMTEYIDIQSFLVKNKFLPENYTQDHFAVFDIECLGVTDTAGPRSSKSTEISDQKIVTVAFSSTFGVPTKVIARDSFSKEDYFSFYTEIVSHIRYMALEYIKTLPDSISEGIVKIQTILDNDKKSESSKLDVYRKSMLQRGLVHLQKMTKMRIYGYNSEKYDQPLILPGILSALKLKPSEIDVIKRGTGVMMLGLNIMDTEVLFVDAMNLSGGGTLSSFSKMFGTDESKGTFPYEHYQTIDEMKNCSSFPKYEAFKSSLKFPDRESFRSKLDLAFEKARLELGFTADKFLNQMSIPEGSYDLPDDPNELPENIDFSEIHCTLDPVTYIDNLIEFNMLKSNMIISDMHGFLCYYNKTDVNVLQEALLKYCLLFKTNLNINPLDFLSLPGLAETIMWRFFDESKGSAFSLRERELNELIHENNFGGATIILGERHQEINVPNADRIYADKVYVTPNGEIICEVRSWDFNNLYGHGIRMPMPVGRAMHYKLNGDFFDWSPVSSSDTYSLDCIEWLNFEQSKFLKSDGTRHVIAHALNKGEVRVFDDVSDEEYSIFNSKMYKPDGMVTIEGVDHFWEFDGCHVHQCPHKCITYRRNMTNPNRIPQRETEERNNFYRSRGVLHTITSCEWYKIRKNVSFKNYTSCFFRSKQITEKAILEKIASDDFFGVILVDIETPPDVVKRFSEVGFGTVFRHMEVSESMIHPTYLSHLKSSKRPFPLDKVLTLAFHAKQILITTEFAKFYLKIGVKLSNITEALEYECDTPLANFVNTVTEQRKQATRTNNSALQNVFKLVANR